MPTTQISYDFTVGAASGLSMQFVQNGVTVTVSSALYYGNSSDPLHVPFEFSTATLSTNAQGIGALNTYGDVDEGFDAHGMYEMVTFSFTQTVKITSIKLIPLGTSYNPTGADTQFITFDQGLVINQDSKQFIDPTDFINNLALYGSLLGFGAVNHLDNFRVAGLTIEIEDTVVLPPLTSVADSYAVKAFDAPVTLNVLANDVNAASITAINTSAVLGSVTLAANGLSLVYDAGSAFDYLAKGATATEAFTYTVLGADGTSQTQTVTLTVTGNPNEITGNTANNTLTGTARHDVILGLAGNDTINGLGGHDEIDGGTGKDLLHGNDGNDIIKGGDGDDSIYGDAGNDTIIGGAGNDFLSGGEGNDNIDGSVNADRMFGDGGNDLLTGGASANVLDGGTGVDTMIGGAGNDSYFVDNVDDLIVELALGGADLVRSTVSYTAASEVENLYLSGTDAINATGNVLANRLIGNAADNTLSGLAGNDRLDAGAGHDMLVGGTGRDNLIGGEGADDFVFAEFGTANYDDIVDFNGLVDSIQLSAATFGLGLGEVNASQFTLGLWATNAAQHLIYDQRHGDLYYDADGNGTGAKQLIASLVDGTALTAADIFAF